MVTEPSRPPPAAPAAVSPRPHDETDRARRDALELERHPGLHLLGADAAHARAHARRIARALSTVLVVETAAQLQSARDPAEAMRLAIREAIVLEQRRLAKVFQGRILETEPPIAPNPADAARGTPAAQIGVRLQTDEDERTIQLEGAWAWNLLESGARVGDVVQIDRKDPMITVLNADVANEGRVLDEREHRLRVSLGALDRAHTAATEREGPRDEGHPTQEEDLIAQAARSSAHIMGTGERPPTSGEARVRTDGYVRQRLGERHTRLLPGVLLVLQAGEAPASALAALRAAQAAPAPPHRILSDPDPVQMEEIARSQDDVHGLEALE